MRFPVRINEAFSSIRSAFIEWDGFLVNNRFIKDRNEITWEGRQNYDINYPLTTTNIIGLVENGQYTFQIQQDGSIFQIYYKYDRRGNRILKTSLSFYYLGAVINQDILDEFEIVEYLPDAEIGWFRIDHDFDPGHDIGVIHAKSHMHISLFPDTRLVVDRPPNPKQFIEFVIATCYPTYYQSKRLNEYGRFNDLAHICNLNHPVAENDYDDHLCDYVAHLQIPSRIAVQAPIPAQRERRRR